MGGTAFISKRLISCPKFKIALENNCFLVSSSAILNLGQLINLLLIKAVPSLVLTECRESSHTGQAFTATVAASTVPLQQLSAEFCSHASFICFFSIKPSHK